MVIYNLFQGVHMLLVAYFRLKLQIWCKTKSCKCAIRAEKVTFLHFFLYVCVFLAGINLFSLLKWVLSLLRRALQMNNEVCLPTTFLLCYHSFFPFGVHSSDNPLGLRHNAELRINIEKEKWWAEKQRKEKRMYCMSCISLVMTAALRGKFGEICRLYACRQAFLHSGLTSRLNCFSLGGKCKFIAADSSSYTPAWITQRRPENVTEPGRTSSADVQRFAVRTPAFWEGAVFYILITVEMGMH